MLRKRVFNLHAFLKFKLIIESVEKGLTFQKPDTRNKIFMDTNLPSPVHMYLDITLIAIATR